MQLNKRTIVPNFILKRLEGRLDLQKIIANTGWLFFDRILRMGVGFFIGIWVARYLGPEQYGLLSYAQAFVALFMPLATLGLDGIVVRNLVREPEKRDEILGSAFILKLLGGFVVIVLSSLTILFIRPDNILTFWLVLITAAGTLFQAFDTIDFWFQSQVQSKYTVYAKNSAFLITAVLRVIFILGHASILAFAVVSFVEILIGSVGLIYVYRRKRANIRTWKPNFATMKVLLHDSWPLILSGLAVMIYMRIDQIMLGEMLGDKEVGIYTAGTKLSEVWYFIPSALVLSLAPSIVKAKQTGDFEYYRLLQILFDMLAIMSYIIIIPLSFLSEKIITLLYGLSFAGSSKVLLIHIWASLFVFLGVARTQYLINEKLTRYSLYTTLIGAIVNVILNYLLIPNYGSQGAATATLISQFIASIGTTFIFRNLNSIGKSMIKAIFLLSIISNTKKYIKRNWV